MPLLLDISAIIILIILIFFGQLILLIPKRAVRTVRANCRRSDGSWSTGRARTELIEIVDVSGNLFLGFLIMLAILLGPLLLVHNYVIPFNIATDIFSAFNLDVLTWEAKIETGDLGDVGAQYEEWGENLGFSSSRLRFWQEFLWAYWPVLLGLVAAITVMFYFFITRLYSKSLHSYTKGVIERRGYYTSAARRKRKRKSRTNYSVRVPTKRS